MIRHSILIIPFRPSVSEAGYIVISSSNVRMYVTTFVAAGSSCGTKWFHIETFNYRPNCHAEHYYPNKERVSETTLGAFVDLKAAFDSVDRMALSKLLYSFGLNSIVDLIEALYTDLC